MKLNKKHYIYIAILAVLMLITVTAILRSGNKLIATDMKQSAEKNQQEKFQTVSEGDAKLENERLTFSLNTATTQFTVVDKENGKTWSSTADLDSEVVGAEKFQSEIVIDYYDSSGMAHSMYSKDNSVAFESYEVKASEDAVRVNYDIRSRQDDFFVPVAFPKDIFEEKILENLPAGPARRMKLYYRLYDATDKDMLSEHPALAEQELYIAIADLSDKDYAEITDYYNEISYTMQDYQKDTEGMALGQSDISAQARFLIPIEYRLTEDGFTAKVIIDEVEEKSEADRLTQIRVLPGFGTLTEQMDGYLLVPDGSGGIISFKEQVGSSYTQQMYGIDYAVDTQLSLQLAETAVMPVFGMNQGNAGFFAIIEGAAENAYLDGQISGNTNPVTGISARFQVLTHDVTDIAAANSDTPFFNLYASDRNVGSPSVRYALLGEKECDYSAMAKYYRNYLIEKGVLAERLKEGGSQLYLDYTGYTTKNASLMGISYDKKILLSKVEDIIEEVKKLQDEGAVSLNVRLKAYSDGGMKNGLVDELAPEKMVGKTQDIKKLSALLKEQGGTLYLDHALGKVYRDTSFDQFNKLDNASRKINKMVFTRGDYDIVLDDLKKNYNHYFLLSPKYYEGLVETFTDSVKKQLGQTKDYGYSWGMLGNSLSSDFNAELTITRGETKDLLLKAVGKAEGYASILTEGGNIYALQNADTILNMPLSDSGFSSVTEAVPFYQMVVHGYRNYAGAALNAVADAETEWLKTVESGASMYYSCITEPYTVIKDLGYRQQLYPISMEMNRDSLLERYQEYEAFFQKVATQTIEKHQILEAGVHLTTYEDGTDVVVNYNNEAVTVGDTVVEAKSYAVNP